MKSGKSLPLLCLSLCAFGAAWASFYSLQGVLISEQASSQAAAAGGSESLADEALSASLRAAARTGSSADAIRAAALLAERAQLSTNLDERLVNFCQASALYRNALEGNPRDSRLLIGLASQQQLLAGYRCPDTPPVGTVSELVDRALYWAPWDRDVLVWGARLKLWSQDREGALQLFSRSLLYSTELTAGQEGEILDELRTAAEFQQVVPSKFPQIIRLSARLKEQRSKEFSLWRADTAQMQLKALDDARLRYEKEELPKELFERELHSLQEVAASDAVRQRIDTELARLARLRGAEVEAEIFQKRAGFAQLQLVPAVAASDTRPAASSLVEWGYEHTLAFDDFYQTIGFYLPPQQGVALIMIKGTIPGQSLNLEAIRVLASEDNERWIEVRPAQIQAFSSGNAEFLAILLQSERHKYWKIHNNSPVRRKQFEGTVREMLLVYGNSSRREGLE